MDWALMNADEFYEILCDIDLQELERALFPEHFILLECIFSATPQTNKFV